MAKDVRELADIELAEVSLVGKAANKKKFLFFKQEGKSATGKKLKKKINIVIDSDGTIGGTKIAVNKDTLKNLRDFSFSFWGGNEDTSRAVSCSYAKFVETEDGFSRSETFYLSKGDSDMEPKVKEQLQKYFGEDEKVDFEKAEESDVVVESLETVNEYQEDFPDDLKKAVGIIAKQAGMYAPPVEPDKSESISKAGAKFSKETLTKLQTLIAAAKALEEVLPKEKEETEKADDGGNVELRKTIDGLTKKLEGLEKQEDDEAKSELKKTVKTLTERLETVEKGTGVRKSEDGQDDEDDNKGEKKWPSFSKPS